MTTKTVSAAVPAAVKAEAAAVAATRCGNASLAR